MGAEQPAAAAAPFGEVGALVRARPLDGEDLVAIAHEKKSLTGKLDRNDRTGRESCQGGDLNPDHLPATRAVQTGR